MTRVIFLFNHDAEHQVSHLAGTAAAFARLHADAETIVAHAPGRIGEAVARRMTREEAARIDWRPLELTPWARALSRVADPILPASRLLRLRQNEALFASANAIVSTERTCLRLKDRLPRDKPRLFVRIPHGSGDRSVTFHPDHRRFDLSLVAGPKLADQLVRNGIARERIEVVGYPKFDTVDLAARPDFFGNGRPTFVYNPHFDPYLSSWYDCGPELLRWFASEAGQRYNLIFAPHVMLFRKRVHISPEYRRAGLRPEVPEEALGAANIRVDVSGPNLFDMSYMLGADAYIGDASSQLYEFLARPRPVFLLDPRGRLRDEGPDRLPFLTTGPVFGEVSALASRISDYKAVGEHFLQVQKQLIDYTFAPGEGPANERAATAIAGRLGLSGH